MSDRASIRRRMLDDKFGQGRASLSSAPAAFHRQQASVATTRSRGIRRPLDVSWWWRDAPRRISRWIHHGRQVRNPDDGLRPVYRSWVSIHGNVKSWEVPMAECRLRQSSKSRWVAQRACTEEKFQSLSEYMVSSSTWRRPIHRELVTRTALASTFVDWIIICSS